MASGFAPVSLVGLKLKKIPKWDTTRIEIEEEKKQSYIETYHDEPAAVKMAHISFKNALVAPSKHARPMKEKDAVNLIDLINDTIEQASRATIKVCLSIYLPLQNSSSRDTAYL